MCQDIEMIRLSKNAGPPKADWICRVFLKALALNRLVQSELKIAQFGFKCHGKLDRTPLWVRE